MARPRTDEVLYSGMTSATTRQVHATRKAGAEVRKQSSAKLTENGDLVVELVEAERKSVAEQMWGLINVDTPADNVKEVALALRMYANYLESFKGQVQSILRANEKVERSDSE